MFPLQIPKGTAVQAKPFTSPTINPVNASSQLVTSRSPLQGTTIVKLVSTTQAMSKKGVPTVTSVLGKPQTSLLNLGNIQQQGTSIIKTIPVNQSMLKPSIAPTPGGAKQPTIVTVTSKVLTNTTSGKVISTGLPNQQKIVITSQGGAQQALLKAAGGGNSPITIIRAVTPQGQGAGHSGTKTIQIITNSAGLKSGLNQPGAAAAILKVHINYTFDHFKLCLLEVHLSADPSVSFYGRPAFSFIVLAGYIQLPEVFTKIFSQTFSIFPLLLLIFWVFFFGTYESYLCVLAYQCVRSHPQILLQNSLISAYKMCHYVVLRKGFKCYLLSFSTMMLK